MNAGPGFALAERVAETIARHRMLAGGDKVVVAVSGGPDSVCLLDVLGRLRADLELVVAYVDHGLGASSEAIAGEVSRRAAAAGHDVHVARAEGLSGPNLHERARDFRLAFFETIRAREEASSVATGHTLDDRVETTLGRFIHGAGPAALDGLPPKAGARIRPLIALRRRETRSYCEEAGLSFFDDPANEDPRFERTVIRRELMAAIESRWGDGGVRAMAASVERIREDALALARQAEVLAEGLLSDEGRIDLATLLGLPRALRRRLLEVAVGHHRDRSAGIDEVLDALEREDRRPGARFAVAGGAEITIGPDHVSITPAPISGEEATSAPARK